MHGTINTRVEAVILFLDLQFYSVVRHQGTLCLLHTCSHVELIFSSNNAASFRPMILFHHRHGGSVSAFQHFRVLSEAQLWLQSHLMLNSAVD